MKTSSLKALQVLVLTSVTVLSTTSLAQQNSGRRGGGFMSSMSSGGTTPDYMLRDLQKFQMALELQDYQTTIVEQMLREYDESFREASDASREGISSSFDSMRGSEDDAARQKSQELRDRSREIRDKLDSVKKLGDEQDMQELQKRLNAERESIRDEMRQARVDQWQSPERQASFELVALLMQDQLRLKRQMREEFEGDLVAILNVEQQVLWPPLQRQLIRDRLLPRGRLSGETVDVMGLVDQQEFDDEVLFELLPVLQEWDLSVTEALTARDDHMIENQGALMSSMRTMDVDSGIEVMETQGRLAQGVRDINDNAVQNILLLLPEDKSADFKTIANERGYPRIFRPTRTDRAFRAALELEGLEPDILQAIEELYASLQIEMVYANEQVLEATHRWEAQEQIDRINRFAQRMSGGSSERAESPIRKAEEDRQKIEDNYLAQLRMLLTEEQMEALGGLKKREERDNRGNRDSADRGSRGSDRGGFEGGREAFMERFDKDGDGTISESERDAIREHFRNGGGRDGTGGGPPRS
ncbi:MAG: hypothetical protein H8E83_01595 [Planctomycetes bacterium]|nr:hypothetical protein [Planctomycetota bacterium]